MVNDNSTSWVAFFCVNFENQSQNYSRVPFSVTMTLFTHDGVSIVSLDAITQQKPTYERRGIVESKRRVLTEYDA